MIINLFDEYINANDGFNTCNCGANNNFWKLESVSSTNSVNPFVVRWSYLPTTNFTNTNFNNSTGLVFNSCSSNNTVYIDTSIYDYNFYGHTVILYFSYTDFCDLDNYPCGRKVLFNVSISNNSITYTSTAGQSVGHGFGIDVLPNAENRNAIYGNNSNGNLTFMVDGSNNIKANFYATVLQGYVAPYSVNENVLVEQPVSLNPVWTGKLVDNAPQSAFVNYINIGGKLRATGLNISLNVSGSNPLNLIANNILQALRLAYYNAGATQEEVDTFTSAIIISASLNGSLLNVGYTTKPYFSSDQFPHFVHGNNTITFFTGTADQNNLITGTGLSGTYTFSPIQSSANYCGSSYLQYTTTPISITATASNQYTVGGTTYNFKDSLGNYSPTNSNTPSIVKANGGIPNNIACYSAPTISIYHNQPNTNTVNMVVTPLPNGTPINPYINGSSIGYNSPQSFQVTASVVNTGCTFTKIINV